MEDKLIPSGPAFAMAVIFLVMGIDHLARFSHQRAFPNLVIGLPTLAIVPTYLNFFTATGSPACALPRQRRTNRWVSTVAAAR